MKAPILENIPAELKALPQWVLWRLETRDGKPTKVPYQPNGEPASSTDPATWRAFPDVVKALLRFSGIGFVLSEAAGVVGIDLDHCIDAETGAIAPWARAIMADLPTYWEASPSGTGAHAFVFGQLPPGRRKKGAIEFYSTARYLTVTGHRLESVSDVADVASAPGAVLGLYLNLLGAARPELKEQKPEPQPSYLLADDPDLIARASTAQNGYRFADLYAGDTAHYKGDESAADLALCSMLAFWTGADPARMDRLFRASGLMRPKWDARRGVLTYGERTIRKALDGCREVYRRPSTVVPLEALPAAPAPTAPEADAPTNPFAEPDPFIDGPDPAAAIAGLAGLLPGIARKIAATGIQLTMRGVKVDAKADVGQQQLTEPARLVWAYRATCESAFRFWLCDLADRLPKRRGVLKEFCAAVGRGDCDAMQLRRNLYEWLPVYRAIRSAEVVTLAVPWYVLEGVARMSAEDRTTWLADAKEAGKVTPDLRRRAIADESPEYPCVDYMEELSAYPAEARDLALRLEESSKRTGKRADCLVRTLAKQARDSRPEPRPDEPAEEQARLPLMGHTVVTEQAPARHCITVALQDEVTAALEAKARAAGVSVAALITAFALGQLPPSEPSEHREESEISDSLLNGGEAYQDGKEDPFDDPDPAEARDLADVDTPALVAAMATDAGPSLTRDKQKLSHDETAGSTLTPGAPSGGRHRDHGHGEEERNQQQDAPADSEAAHVLLTGAYRQEREAHADSRQHEEDRDAQA